MTLTAVCLQTFLEPNRDEPEILVVGPQSLEQGRNLRTLVDCGLN